MIKKYLNWSLVAIVTLAYAVFIVGFWRAPVPTVDGVVRASEARTIFESGQWWPIVYEGQTVADHPPLYLWLTVASYKIFGVNDFAANFVSRFFAFLSVIITAVIALEAGLGLGVATLSTLILCTTRDFVLSSVRGYLEPVLEFFIYLAVYFGLAQKTRMSFWPAFFAGLSVWLAAFTKGPVALWPFLFILLLFFWSAETIERKIKTVFVYFFAFLLMSSFWALWVQKNNLWDSWSSYFFDQVLNSALKGRNGAQERELLFFIKILLRYYWPWFPVLIWALYKSYQSLFKRDFSSLNSFSYIFLILALGFIGGFSLMKWKFWYYIAPAYPALSIFIACQIDAKYRNAKINLENSYQLLNKIILAMSMGWIFVGTVFPIQLHKERISEVHLFKPYILNSPNNMRVWFVRNTADHNMMGTSGQWYFQRKVEKVNRENEQIWAKQLEVEAKSAWIIVGTEYFKGCQSDRVSWCGQSEVLAQNERSSLVRWSPK